jgi:hypothetical protein
VESWVCRKVVVVVADGLHIRWIETQPSVVSLVEVVVVVVALTEKRGNHRGEAVERMDHRTVDVVDKDAAATGNLEEEVGCCYHSSPHPESWCPLDGSRMGTWARFLFVEPPPPLVGASCYILRFCAFFPPFS